MGKYSSISSADPWSKAKKLPLPDYWEIVLSEGYVELQAANPRFLRDEVGASISLAVESLNRGFVTCENGLCIVYDAAEMKNFLLYRQEKEDWIRAHFQAADG